MHRSKTSKRGSFGGAEWVFLIGLAVFLLASLFLVDDYGMNNDSQKNYAEGKMHVDFLLTGRVDEYILSWQMHGAWVFMLAELVKRALADGAHILDPVAARHIILPFMTAGFLVALFAFVRRRLGAFHGLIAAGILLTFPYYFGHGFNNLKDIPLLIFVSLAIMSFAEWSAGRGLGYLYGFFISWGLALSIKSYAAVVPVILALWWLARPKEEAWGEGLPRRRLALHAAVGFAVTVAIVLLLYAPAFWGVEGKLSFLRGWRENVKQITGGSFTFHPYVQVFFRTPLLVLVLAIAGVVEAVRGFRRSSLYSLLLIWVAVPLVIASLPRTLIYHNGMRLFIVFLVPFSLLATLGLGAIAAALAPRLKRRRAAVAPVFAAVTIGANLWGIVSTHPYETTFFNALAGGLGGAQKKGIPDSFDYWLNSYKEAGAWINRFGAPNAWVLALYASATPPAFNTDLVGESIERTDLRTFRLPGVALHNGEIAIPGNTYALFVPFEQLKLARPYIEGSGQFEKVYTISRQGGEVCSIYYKRPGP